MNIELLESFGQNFPQDFDGSLDSVSSAAVAAFNRLGSMLAVGCNDGRVVIWDFMTKGIAKVIQPHTHTICSLCWSRNGRKIITAAIDSNVCISDVLTGDIDRRLKFPSPVLKVQYNPRNSRMILITPMQHAAVVIDLDDNGTHVHRIIPADDDDLNICSNFDRRGQHIFTGNSRSKISIFRSSDLSKVASFRISKEGSNVIAVKSIEFSRRGEWFLVNSGDRMIRVYNQNDVLLCNDESETGDPEPVQKLQDLVNKTMWKKCAFSGDGEYICAGSARQHAIYIWERCGGNLVKILNGAKGEMLLDVVWHPIRPIVASVSSGVVSVWAQNQVENWSAFAPDFKELDENVEYEERESEFDLEDEDKIPETLMENGEDEIEVDVSTSQPVGVLLSSDEEDNAGLEDNLDFLPIAPEVEEQDENWCLDSKYDDRLKSSYEKENTSSPKRKKPKIIKEVVLPDAPKDLEHPMLTKSGKEKGLGNRKGGSAYKVKNDKRHHKDRMK